MKVKFLFPLLALALAFTVSCKSKKKLSKTDLPKTNPCEALEAERDVLARIKDSLLSELNNTNARWSDSMSRALEKEMRLAMPDLMGDEFGVEMRNGQLYVTMTDKLLFPTGSADINSRGADVLKKFAGVLQKNPSFLISVEGHTDNQAIKSAKYVDNWDLSAARSLAVIRMLTKDLHVKPNRFTLVGKAWYAGVASNDTPEGRSRNRRIEFVMQPSKEKSK